METSGSKLASYGTIHLANTIPLPPPNMLMSESYKLCFTSTDIGNH